LDAPPRIIDTGTARTPAAQARFLVGLHAVFGLDQLE
jgi:hypothetical protein